MHRGGRFVHQKYFADLVYLNKENLNRKYYLKPKSYKIRNI